MMTRALLLWLLAMAASNGNSFGGHLPPDVPQYREPMIFRLLAPIPREDTPDV
jgi:hypothetical protein